MAVELPSIPVTGRMIIEIAGHLKGAGLVDQDGAA